MKAAKAIAMILEPLTRGSSIAQFLNPLSILVNENIRVYPGSSKSYLIQPAVGVMLGQLAARVSENIRRLHGLSVVPTRESRK